VIGRLVLGASTGFVACGEVCTEISLTLSFVGLLEVLLSNFSITLRSAEVVPFFFTKTTTIPPITLAIATITSMSSTSKGEVFD